MKVNCAAIPRELIESELFGHERGAFTGAQAKRRGLFEQAHGGTLFLDEIGDMDLVAQAKVLRALQSGEISRVGSEHVIHVDVRVLAATNKDLAKGVETGAFREDLFFRLDVFPHPQPGAARARRGHPAPRGGVHGAVRAARTASGPSPSTTTSSRRSSSRKWPGNVRELKNVVERSAILSRRSRHHRRPARGPAREPLRGGDATRRDGRRRRREALEDERDATRRPRRRARPAAST